MMQRSQRQGFTLIEVLVVVAVMGVLVGLLVPVLAAARGSAGTAACGSNLRELAQANIIFAQDNDQRYVPGAADFIRNLNRWHGRRGSVHEPFNHTQGPLASYLGAEGRVQQCPAYRPDATGFEVGCGGYGYNNEYVGRSRLDDPAPPDNDLRGGRVDVFASPRQTVMFTDAAIARQEGGEPIVSEYSFAEPPFFATGAEGWPTTPSIHFRHGGQANAVYLDGHVDSHAMSFTRASVYGVSEQESRALGIGYFGPRDNSWFDRQ
jgi:prepilin-type N-terminal cleavage/methylation domain-containing protein/prepilin-type processing-associated H-X9-DG protein